MRAVVLSKFGGPEALEIWDLPRPEPGPGELLVRIIASALNPVEAKIRAAGSWARIPLPGVVGYDAAGIVEACGPGCTDFAPGDAVFYTPEIFGNQHGTHAEYGVVPQAIVARKPSSASFVEAAALPLAGGTAYEAIVRRLVVQVGDTVLIHGGAGGVGSFAIQIAKACGARVLATASAGNQALLRELGADIALDYGRDDVSERALKETGGRGVDVVFDTVGGNLISKSLEATRPFGRLATISAPEGDLSMLYLKNQSLYGIFLQRERARLEALAQLVDQGRLRSISSQVIPFDIETLRESHRRLDSGHGAGKVVIRISDELAGLSANQQEPGH